MSSDIGLTFLLLLLLFKPNVRLCSDETFCGSKPAVWASIGNENKCITQFLDRLAGKAAR